MRLKRLMPGSYKGRIGPYAEAVDRQADGWLGVIEVTRGTLNAVEAPTLEEAKAGLVMVYLKRRLNILHKRHRGEPDFGSLYRSCWEMRDALAPSALADWLEERGDGFIALVASEGDRAGVRWWPAGWAEALARAT